MKLKELSVMKKYNSEKNKVKNYISQKTSQSLNMNDKISYVVVLTQII